MGRVIKQQLLEIASRRKPTAEIIVVRLFSIRGYKMSKLKKSSIKTLTLEKGGLLTHQSGEIKRLICDNCQEILVNDLIAILHSNIPKSNGNQSFKLKKTASCFFLFHNVMGTIVGTRTDQLMDLEGSTIDDIKRSMDSHYNTGFPRLVYSHYCPNTPVELLFAYNDNEWSVVRVKNVSSMEINFLYSILQKYNLI